MRPLASAWRGAGVAVALVPRGTALAALPGLLGCRAEAVVTRREARGKPLLDRPAGAAFSVAHRAGWSLIAAGRHRAVGVDLELVRDDLPVEDIAETCFGAGEARWVRGLPSGCRALGFTIVWTIKEAVLKATGRGIAGGMSDPAVAGGALLPLLEGAEMLEPTIPGFGRVQVRQGTIGRAHAVAGVAVIG